MGTPEFAVASLQKLVESGYNVVGVVTMPDKPKGRSHSVLQPSPVKEYAVLQNIPVLQPEKLKEESFLKELKDLKADLQIVVAFRMLPEVVWGMPPLGTFNLHGSLLPQYRGAAPINWAIINGEKETGVTTFFLDKEIDTGRIIDFAKIPISEIDNAGTIHDRLMEVGSDLVIRTVENIRNNLVTPILQENFSKNTVLKPAPKLFKETCKINWDQTTDQVYNFIRGLSPYPAAWTEIEVKSGILTLKIFETERISQSHNFPPGKIISDGKRQLDVSTTDGFIRLKNIQPAGKKRMSTEDFLRGNSNLLIDVLP